MSAGAVAMVRPAPGMRGGSVDHVAPENVTPGLLAEWRGIAAQASEDNAFFWPDFVLSAARHLGQGPHVATVRDAAGRLVALAPVTRTRLGRIAPAVRTWAHDYAPLGVPLVDPDGLGANSAAFLEGVAGGASLIVPDLPLDGPVAAALVAAADAAGRPVDTVDGHLRAMLRRPPGPVDCRAALSTRRRKEYGRQMRRLAETGSVSGETATEPDIVRARFEEFLALEQAGWKGRAGTALAARAATAAFARSVVAAGADAGAVRIDSIRVGAAPVAMLVSFLAASTAYTWKIAFDEAHARFSPGAQLMLDAPRSLFADARIDRIDSCAVADHPMIDHLWKDRLAVGTLVIGPPGGGMVHRLGLAALRAEIEARQAARRLRTRLSARRRNRETES